MLWWPAAAANRRWIESCDQPHSSERRALVSQIVTLPRDGRIFRSIAFNHPKIPILSPKVCRLFTRVTLIFRINCGAEKAKLAQYPGEDFHMI